MAQRVAAILAARPGRGRPPLVATFHATCARVLRAEIHHLGYPRSFVIYDEDDRLALVRECYKELGLDERVLGPSAAIARISRAKNQLLGPEAVEEAVRGPREADVARLYARYAARLRALGAVDFDDLLGLTVELFTRHPDVLGYYRDLWRYVLVDEYQDTNAAQYRMLRQLTAVHRNLCVVGDPDQSIYRFRGADLRNILDFERDFPGCRVVRLEQNYRSTGRILEIAAAVIAHNQARKEKSLWTENVRGEAGAALPGPGRDRGGALGGADRGRAARGRPAARRRRGALPDERPVARAGGRLPGGGPALPHRGQRPLLRAAGDQGRPRVPPARHEPRGRPRLPARPGRPAARDRADHARPPRGARGGRRGAASGHGGARARGDRGPGRPRARGIRAPGRTAHGGGGRAGAARRAGGGGRRRHRAPRGPPPGEHGRGREPAREPGRADRRRRGVRRASGRRRPRGVPRLRHLDRGRGRASGSAPHRHAHDASLGQGARVSRGVPHRAGGGSLPPRPRPRRRGRDRGGAPAGIRGPHPGEGAALPVVRGRAPPRRLRGPARALTLSSRDAGRRRRADRQPTRGGRPRSAGGVARPRVGARAGSRPRPGRRVPVSRRGARPARGLGRWDPHRHPEGRRRTSWSP